MRRVWAFTLTLLPAVAACGWYGSGGLPAPRAATTPTISAADLRIRESIFSDDSMLGRRAGTIGNTRGNAYIAGEVARLGLRPAGDNGGFLQAGADGELRDRYRQGQAQGGFGHA